MIQGLAPCNKALHHGTEVIYILLFLQCTKIGDERINSPVYSGFRKRKVTEGLKFNHFCPLCTEPTCVGRANHKIDANGCQGTVDLLEIRNLSLATHNY